MKISFEFWMSESDKNFSRKDAKHAKLGEDRKIFFFAPWRLGANNFFKAVWLKN